MTDAITVEKESTQEMGLSDKSRADVADGLSVTLADTFTLYLKTHAYHWNVTGPRFPQLHDFLEEQYEEIWAAVDVLAERIRGLGYAAPGSLAEYTKLTNITEEPGVESPEADAMLRNLLEGHETLVRGIRNLIRVAEEADDDVTVDVLTARIEQHEKHAWMIRSTLD